MKKRSGIRDTRGGLKRKARNEREALGNIKGELMMHGVMRAEGSAARCAIAQRQDRMYEPCRRCSYRSPCAPPCRRDRDALSCWARWWAALWSCRPVQTHKHSSLSIQGKEPTLPVVEEAAVAEVAVVAPGATVGAAVALVAGPATVAAAASVVAVVTLVADEAMVAPASVTEVAAVMLVAEEAATVASPVVGPAPVAVVTDSEEPVVSVAPVAVLAEFFAVASVR